jgi:hypothetical protein
MDQEQREYVNNLYRDLTAIGEDALRRVSQPRAQPAAADAAIDPSRPISVTSTLALLLVAITIPIGMGLLVQAEKWSWGFDPFETGFIGGAGAALAIAALLAILRRRVLSSGEGGFYWLICSLLLLTGATALFETMKWQWRDIADTGLGAGSALVLVLTALLMLVRRKSMGGAELALYWLSLSLAGFGDAVVLSTTLSQQWPAIDLGPLGHIADADGFNLVATLIASALILLSAFVLGITRGGSRADGGAAIYWFGGALAVMAGLPSLFSLLRFRLWGLSAPDTGFAIAGLIAAGSAVIMAASRWRRLVGMELPFYWIGASAATISVLPRLCIAFDWTWNGLNPVQTGVSLGGLTSMASAALLLLGRWRALRHDEVALFWLGCLAAVWLGLEPLWGDGATLIAFLAILVGGAVLIRKVYKRGGAPPPARQPPLKTARPPGKAPAKTDRRVAIATRLLVVFLFGAIILAVEMVLILTGGN